MKKSLPLLAGAIIVPLLAASVAAFASVGGATEAPVATLPPSSSATVLEAPVELATTPPTTTAPPIQTTLAHAPADQGLVPQDASEPEPTTTTPIPTEQPASVPPNEWQTPEPSTTPPAPPIQTPDMIVSWDGLKCARSEAWTVQTDTGAKRMCPGSANP